VLGKQTRHVRFEIISNFRVRTEENQRKYHDAQLTISRLAFTSSSQKFNFFCAFCGFEFSFSHNLLKACNRDSKEADIMIAASSTYFKYPRQL
jgi:hypothetical protein